MTATEKLARQGLRVLELAEAALESDRLLVTMPGDKLHPRPSNRECIMQAMMAKQKSPPVTSWGRVSGLVVNLANDASAS